MTADTITTESQLTAIRDLLTPLLGTEVCLVCRPIPKRTCPECNGAGQRNVADGLSVVECVQEAADELKDAWAVDDQRVEWQQKAEQERDELREQVAKLRAALAPFASWVGEHPPFDTACLDAAEVLAATAPKEPAK